MKVLLYLSFLSLLITAVFAWTKEDHEIFDLVSALEAAEGKGTTFYSWLDVSPSASSADIGRAYRKKSVLLHPDKNGGEKLAHERFARLGVIAKILRNSEDRERYDFFYKNGVPKWRGTGYYYSRYRPGLGSVTIFLIFVTNGLHYIIQRITYKNELTRIDRFVSDARQAAWGTKMVPIEGKRKVKVNVGGRSYQDDEGNVVPGGKWIDMVVEGDDVFILEPNGDLLPLDDSAAAPPSFQRTWFVALVLSLFNKARTKTGLGDSESHNLSDDKGDDLGSGTDSASGTQTPPNGAGVVKGPTVMAGGRRRKVVAKKKKSSGKDKEKS